MLTCRPFIVVVAIAICAPATLAQEVITLRPVADNTLYDSPTGSLSNGAGLAFFAGRNAAASNSIRRGLILFDVAGSLPAGATILSVSLDLFNDAANSGEQAINLHRATESWGEGASVAGGASGGGGGAPATSGDATWLHRSFDATLWSTPGGAFSDILSASTPVAGEGHYTWSSTQLAADVQSFLDAPAANFGWIVLGNELAASSAKRFATREEADLTRQPALTITFIPAPGAGFALALGAFASTGWIRRRPPLGPIQG